MSFKRFRQTAARYHDDLFDSDFSATFFDYDGGAYDPDKGKITGETRSKLISLTVEITPPGIDSTVDTDGTNLSFDTSIRFPLSDTSKTYDTDTTIASGVTKRYSSITVQNGVTLTVNGTLLTGTATINGTIKINGTLITVGSSGVDPFATSLRPLGDDNERPTEVEISNPKTGNNDTYELHSYKYEKGSGMVMCRLVEQ